MTNLVYYHPIVSCVACDLCAVLRGGAACFERVGQIAADWACGLCALFDKAGRRGPGPLEGSDDGLWLGAETKPVGGMCVRTSRPDKVFRWDPARALPAKEELCFEFLFQLLLQC